MNKIIINILKITLIGLILLFVFIGLVPKENQTKSMIDKIGPSIFLEDGNNIIVCPNLKYIESGYEAIDNTDGNVTSKVVTFNNNDNIIYFVHDNNYNYNSAIRKIIHKDVRKPIIKLKGSEKIDINIGEDYQELGFIATDNCDGDITDKVVITNNIDNNNIGTYYVKYEVTDRSNNKNIYYRKVSVKKPKVLPNIPTPSNEKGTIYLTFDDGPSSLTSSILDILSNNGVKATFFVTGSVDEFGYILKREHEMGNAIALHTYTHNYEYIYSSPDNYFNDLDKISNSVYNEIGIKSKIIRFPGGSSNTVSRRYYSGIMTYLSSRTLELGYRYYDWNVDSNDAGNDIYNSNNIYNNVINRLSYDKANIVLMHDSEQHYATRDALDRIIKYGLNNGYTFKIIDDKTEMVRHGINN